MWFEFCYDQSKKGHETSIYEKPTPFYLEIIELQTINWLLMGQLKLLAIRLKVVLKPRLDFLSREEMISALEYISVGQV